jgi:hypothetical protein
LHRHLVGGGDLGGKFLDILNRDVGFAVVSFHPRTLTHLILNASYYLSLTARFGSDSQASLETRNRRAEPVKALAGFAGSASGELVLMLTMKTYELTLRRDDTTTKRISAESISDAKRIACDEEGLPLSAVVCWSVIPTAKQITKTKSLLRGI